ncbi:MAG: tetratricopeptide repeat protein [Verrucomicrobiota bacterium]|jgi:tetratricopeptide (TPR) repeat protein
MPNMGEYTYFIRVLLGEGAKYLLLLLFCVLAIRLWRRQPKLSAGNKRGNLLMACSASVMACGIGYLSICHSLSRLYSYYGMRAFNSGYFLPAFSLFHTSSKYWKSADALGKQGVCLLFLGAPNRGIQLLNEVKTLRKGQNTSFENYYEGLFFYFQEQFDKAVPLLEASSGEIPYRWNVTKLFAVIQLDKNHPEEAERLMKPFIQTEVTDYDHAYVKASLDLFEGKKAEAKMLVDKFDLESLPPFWKSRFDNLRAKIQNQSP